MARKKKKYHYIYRITCLKNNRYYIGMHSTDNLEDGYMGGGKIIKNSVKKHGKDAHLKEILEFFENKEDLVNREIQLVNEELLNDPMCMNLQPGGGGGTINKDHLNYFCKAGNLAFQEKLKDPEYRKNFIEKTKNSLVKARKKSEELYKSGKFRLDTFKGKKHSHESIEKMRNVDRTGIKNSQFGTFWIFHPDLGSRKIKSEEFSIFESEGWRRGRK